MGGAVQQIESESSCRPFGTLDRDQRHESGWDEETRLISRRFQRLLRRCSSHARKRGSVPPSFSSLGSTQRTSAVASDAATLCRCSRHRTGGHVLYEAEEEAAR